MQIKPRAVPGAKFNFLFLALVLVIGAMGYPYHEAHAATEPGWYLGFGAGKFRETSGSLIEEPSQSTGRKYFAGYDIYGFLALEVGYMDLNGPADELGLATANQTYDIAGPVARGLLSVPIYQNIRTRVSLFASGGAFRWDSRSTLTSGAAITTGSVRDVSSTVGGGIWIRTKNASTRIEVEQIYDIDDPIFTGVQLDLRMWTISFIYHF